MPPVIFTYPSSPQEARSLVPKTKLLPSFTIQLSLSSQIVPPLIVMVLLKCAA